MSTTQTIPTTQEPERPVAQIFNRDALNPSVCVVDGYGITVTMSAGQLLIKDGIGQHRRQRRFDRATHGLRRLVIVGTSGQISLDALEWCHKLSIAVIVITSDGDISLASTPKYTDDARLRRAQARAVDTTLGQEIANRLITAKLAGQAKNLRSGFSNEKAASTIEDLSAAADDSTDFDDLRQIEATAAALYFQSWAATEATNPRFATQDKKKIPPHWLIYEGRRSVLSSSRSNKKAERPVNAILNYLYALLEIEAVLACHAVGLDPGLGVLHADTKSRASFALDLIEPIRPAIDAYVIELLAQRTFKKSDFYETPDGNCRLLAPLTHQLAETMSLWAKELAPWAEEIAHKFGNSLNVNYQPVTTLTKTKSKTAQAVTKARKENAQTRASKPQKPRNKVTTSQWTCPDCAAPVTNHRHVRCDNCINNDPKQTKEIRSRRGAAIAARKQAIKEWEQSGLGETYDPNYFKDHILQQLKTVKLADIVQATGLSKSYASQIRNGIYEPHMSVWTKLETLASHKTSVSKK